MATKPALTEGLRGLPSGKIQARYRAPDGTRRTLGTFPDAKAARRALAVKEHEIESNKWLDDRKAEIRFEEFAWQVFNYKERFLKRGTVSDHKSALNLHLLPVFGDKRLCDITTRDVDQWFTRWTGGKVSRQHVYSLLHNYLEHAVRWEYLARNPAKVVGGFADPSAPRPVFRCPDIAAR